LERAFQAAALHAAIAIRKETGEARARAHLARHGQRHHAVGLRGRARRSCARRPGRLGAGGGGDDDEDAADIGGPPSRDQVGQIGGAS
jgi:hypothetical protein